MTKKKLSYWDKRSIREEEAVQRGADVVEKNVTNAYLKAQDYLTSEVKKIYNRYLNKTDKSEAEVKGFASSNVIDCDVFMLTRQKGSSKDYEDVIAIKSLFKLSPSYLETKTYHFKTGPNADEGYIRFDNNGTTNSNQSSLFLTEITVVEGKAVTGYAPSSKENASKSEVTQLHDQITQTVNKVETVDGKVTSQQSQITQLSNNISLKVDKDKAVAQINLSPETIRLDAKRIHLAGASLIDDAVIKEAMIADAAITNAKIQNATISDAKIISINANKVNASTLSAITTNTGQLNVTGWLDFTTENRGLRGTFDFYDVPDDSYYSRWYDGEMRMSHRHLILTSNIYNVNNNSTRGAFKYYSETLYGPDYVKLRQYKGEDKKTVLSRVDIRADAIEIGKDWSFTKSIILKTDGTSVFGGRALFNDGMDVSVGLRVGRIEAPMNYQSLIFNEGRNLGTIELSYDGKRLIRSMDIYDRTYNSQPTVCITDIGTLGRIVSARKYKSDIQTAYDLIDKAKSIISIQPKSWVDKKEMNGKRHYGFIADEFEESNLKEVVFYNSKGEVEGLAYDRISMYQNVVLADHEKKISDLEIKILKLEEIINNGK